MKTCPKCGAVNEDDYKFCQSCAHEFSTSETAEGSSRLKGKIGGTQYRADSQRTHTTAHSSSTTKNASSNLKGRVGETKYVPTDNGTQKNRFSSSKPNEVSSSFKGRMGETRYVKNHTSTNNTTKHTYVWSKHWRVVAAVAFALVIAVTTLIMLPKNRTTTSAEVATETVQNGAYNHVYATAIPSTNKTEQNMGNHIQSVITEAPASTKIPTPTRAPEIVSFADTYWWLQTGYGPGLIYEVHFLSDGTYDAYSHAGKYVAGTYRYDNTNEILYLDNDAYRSVGGEYKSLELFYFMGGPSEGVERTLAPSTRSEYVAYKELPEAELPSASTVAPTSIPTQAPVTSLKSSLPDGEYFFLEVYQNDFYEDSGYLCVYVDRFELITFDEDYVRSLRAGDVIDLSTYGYHELVISIESITDVGNSFEIVSQDSQRYSISYDSTEDAWCFGIYAGFGWLRYVAGTETLVFSEDVEVVDSGWGASLLLGDPRDVFDNYSCESLYASITISNGLVTRIALDPGNI